MTREAMSARKLADLIRERLADPNVRVAVYFEKGKSWRAIAYGSSDTLSETQKRVDEVVNELRNVYDLTE
jgi:hypothetical protein